jgi:predicted TPR repeat methyltransferase
MQNPALNPAIRLSPVPNGYLAYDPGSDRLHELNPIAALIVELCDGSRTVEEIREVVQPIAPQNLGNEIGHWIQQGIEVGLFTLGNGHSTARQELSADELTKLAKRLRDKGRIETAYQCQRRITELSPQNPDAWEELGELAHILGRRDEARSAYERYLELEPDDAETRHMLIALRDESPPPRAPDECIQQMYQRFSSFFEFNLCEELGYEGPQRLYCLIQPVIGDRRELSVADLGCGSGLMGVQVKPAAARMIGVDLSPEMIALARARNIYDDFEVAEITRWLATARDNFDLITACDCFIYFGDLRQIVTPAAGKLAPEGILAFTVERGDQYPYRLTDSGRYTHHPQHIRDAAAEAKLNVVRLEEGFLRMEYGEEVTALFAVLQKPA